MAKEDEGDITFKGAHAKGVSDLVSHPNLQTKKMKKKNASKHSQLPKQGNEKKRTLRVTKRKENH